DEYKSYFTDEYKSYFNEFHDSNSGTYYKIKPEMIKALKTLQQNLKDNSLEGLPGSTDTYTKDGTYAGSAIYVKFPRREDYRIVGRTIGELAHTVLSLNNGVDDYKRLMIDDDDDDNYENHLELVDSIYIYS